MLVLEGVEVEKRDILSDRETMLTAFDHLGPIERSIICETVQRLGQGSVDYGVMTDKDLRDWLEQGVQELIDGNVYWLRKARELQFVEVELQRRGVVTRFADLKRDTEPCDPVIEVNCEPDWEK